MIDSEKQILSKATSDMMLKAHGLQKKESILMI